MHRLFAAASAAALVPLAAASATAQVSTPASPRVGTPAAQQPVGPHAPASTAEAPLLVPRSGPLPVAPFAVGLSRQSRRIIHQNVFVSLGVVALLVPATILGLGIGPAVVMHEGSTLLVVFNALRLLAYRDPSD